MSCTRRVHECHRCHTRALVPWEAVCEACRDNSDSDSDSDDDDERTATVLALHRTPANNDRVDAVLRHVREQCEGTGCSVVVVEMGGLAQREAPRVATHEVEQRKAERRARRAATRAQRRRR